MKSRSILNLVTVTFLALGLSSVVNAQSYTLNSLKNEISNIDSKPIQKIEVTFSNTSASVVENNPDSSDSSWPDDAMMDRIARIASSVPGSRITITGSDGAGIPFGGALGGTLPDGGSLNGGSLGGTLAVGGSLNGGSQSPALPGDGGTTASNCVSAASAWKNGLTKRQGRNKRSDDVVIVFDENGSECWRSDTRITQGDYIYIGVYGAEESIKNLKIKVPTCSLEPTAINLLDSTVGVTTQSAGDALKKFSPIECFDDQIDVQILQASNALKFSHTLKQYKRYRGTFQIGVLWTNLEDPNYTLTDLGNGNEIRSDIDDSTGPHYTASLVVYGIPHYLRSLSGSSGYSGRDIVNENSFADRLGLALTFGLSEPKDTLGVGLSFEVATGINLTATQLYRRINRLDGVSEGDAFAGTADMIPRKKTWEDDVVFGLSIDGRYLTKFFGSDGN